MRVGIASDLHLECDRRTLKGVEALAGIEAADQWLAMIDVRRMEGHPLLGPDLQALQGTIDVLILAGDIDVGAASVAYAEAAGRFLSCPVIFVPGNHEFFELEMEQALADMRAAAAAAEQVWLLDRDRRDIEIKGKCLAVLGATLWTDYALRNVETSMTVAARGLNDHCLIKYGDRAFLPVDALELHRKARAWLSDEAPKARVEADKVLVVTHHAPSPKGAAPWHRTTALTPAFSSDLTQEILAWNPDLWVWGHTHYSCAFKIGQTRMVAAQRGYLGKDVGAEMFQPRVIQL